VGLNSLKSLNLTNVYPNNKKNNNNNKVKSKPLELRSRVKNSQNSVRKKSFGGTFCFSNCHIIGLDVGSLSVVLSKLME
jgi:hypothetical protein